MQEERTNVPKIRFKGFTKDWEQRKLDDVVEFYSGLTYSPDNVQDDGTFVLRSSNVKNGEIIDADNVYVSHEVVNSGNVQEGDVIVVVRNGSRDLIGKHAQIKRQMDNTVIGAFMTGVRSETPDFTNAMLDTQQFAVEINKNLGATINQITTGAFKKMQFVVPKDRDEREAIGTFFRSIDDTITLHQRKLDLLKETKKGFLQKMFPKNGAKVPEIRFSGFTEDWEQRKLGEMVKQFSIKSKKEDEYTVLSSTNSGMEIRDGRVSGTSNLGYKIVEDGDLVLSPQNLWLGNININDIGKGLVSPSYKTFKFTNINSAFLKPQLHTSKMLEEYKNSSTQGASIVRRNLELDSFYQIPMLVPTTEEQSKLGVFFESMDNTITLHQRELDSLKEMKKSLLQQMFV
ncbi:restriction endonuclease subunit S [Enterococcus faecium]|uniref:restriction endonuclease subunit S n=1 Tax=Enterococcus TaxID=1350 RepID=UPI0019E00D70|nr:restriction endonuclease subunit S [Enterococcus faecium]EGP4910207.1 restriction endonuclease subunit S [Enterococcus faecium]EHS1287598.1 restriction endonuclease subunit S [Enterococcus faecium]EME7202824.1 restriction endonuclease subunit S [Enterococcus faecium]MDK4434937.1 restriction endonuclease subunit S [Enterococcus faecium]